MGTALRIVRDRQIAEDVAQEAYIRTRRAIDRAPIEHIEAFLHQTARNLAIDHERRRKTRARYEQPPGNELDVESIADEVSTAEAVLIQRERIRRFEEVLHQLPERVRRAWALSQLDGWTYARIAEHLGVSRNTVFNDVKRAMGHCHDALLRTDRE